MIKGYTTYAAAVRNCKRDEMTIHDSSKKLYFNKKGLNQAFPEDFPFSGGDLFLGTPEKTKKGVKLKYQWEFKLKKYFNKEVKIKRFLRDALIIYCILSVIVGVNILNNLH